MIYYFFGINVRFQNYIILNIFVFFPLYILSSKVKYTSYDMVIITSLLYFLIIIPISTGFNIYESFKTYKDIILPFIIFLFFRANFLSFKKLNDFSNTIIIGGIFCVLYIFFEIITKRSSVGLDVWFKLGEYVDIYHPWVSSVFDGTENFLKNDIQKIGVLLSYLRPHGIFLDIHTQAFVINCAIFACLSNIVNNRNKSIWKWYYFLLIGLLFTTSTLHIITVILILILFYYKSNRQRQSRKINKKFFQIIFSVIFAGILFFPFYLKQYLGHKIGFGVDQLSVLDVLIDGLLYFPIAIYELANLSIKTFLIGNGSSETAVIGGELHYIGELITYVGVIGTIFYLIPYALPLLYGLKILNRYNKHYPISPYFLISAFLPIVIIGTLWHYSPVNYCTVFLMGLCLFTGFQDYCFINDPKNRSYKV